MSTHVFYYLAGTLGESERHPNVFSLPKKNQHVLSDITESFPLSGSFHFRFKTKIKDYGHVWMDLNNPNSPVPKFGSMIFAKVLQLDKVRFSGVSRGRQEAGTRNPAAPNSKSLRHKRPQQQQQQQSRQSRQSKQSKQSKQENQSQAPSQGQQQTREKTKPRQQEQQQQRAPANDDDDMFSFSTNKSPNKPMAGAIYSTVDSAPDIAPADVRNALGRLATSTNKVETKMADTSEMSAAVKKKYLQRKADMQANIDAKLAHHLLEAEQVEKDQVERDSVKTRLKPKLLAWSGDPAMGTLKNIRALLATMDSILWSGAKWKTLGMGDLVQPNRVKIGYYKAIRIAHPDRVQTGTVEEKYVASWVLDMLKISWETFKNKEM